MMNVVKQFVQKKNEQKEFIHLIMLKKKKCGKLFGNLMKNKYK